MRVIIRNKRGQIRSWCRVLNGVIGWIENMPLAQGILSMTALGAVAGSVTYSGGPAAAVVIKIAALAAVFGLGGLTLWLLGFDRRTERRFLSTVVAALMGANIAYLLISATGHLALVDNLLGIVLSGCVFSVAIRRYFFAYGDSDHPERRDSGEHQRIG